MKLKIILLCLFSFKLVHLSKILFLFPWNAYSHFVQGKVLAKALAIKGHNVTMLSSLKSGFQGLNNYEEINIDLNQVNKKRFFDYHQVSSWTQIVEFNQLGLTFTQQFMESSTLQKLISSETDFDLIVMDQFLNEAFLGFQHKYQCPVVLVSTLGSNVWNNHLMANPAPTSFVPLFWLGYRSEMTILQRFHNLILTIGEQLYREIIIYPEQNRIIQKYFPGNPPELKQLIYNASLLLISSHISTNYPVPLMPNMIEVGGYHVEDPEPLPTDLQVFLDSSTEGVIYFAMGSNLKSSELTAYTTSELLRAFSKLNQRVLWKYEEMLPDLPKNVYIRKWIPQTAVLKHPNVKVFISHGGLMSAIEAVYFGVPVLGLPVFADQKMNIDIAIDLGYALSVSLSDITTASIENSLTSLIENKTFKENAVKRSNILHDRAVKPLDLAVFWVEYVIRHGGAYHYKSAALKLRWWQYYQLDVVVLCLVALTMSIFFIKRFFSSHLSSKHKID